MVHFREFKTHRPHRHCAAVVSVGWAKASECYFQICLSSLSSTWWCPSSIPLVQLVSSSSRRSSSRSFPFVIFPDGDTRCPYVISYSTDVDCSGSLPLSGMFNHVCDICLLSYPKTFVFCPGILCLTYSFSIFVFAAGYLWFYYLVNSHVSAPNVIDGTEVRMCCWCASSCRFNIYPYRCLGAWRMISSRLLVFVSGTVLFCQLDVAFNVH